MLLRSSAQAVTQREAGLSAALKKVMTAEEAMEASLVLPTAVGNQPSLGLSPDGLHAVVAGQHVLQTILWHYANRECHGVLHDEMDSWAQSR